MAAATNKATITESNSLLLAQLITNDPEGSFRRPPQAVLDQLAQANQHYKIGKLYSDQNLDNPFQKLFILQTIWTIVQFSSKWGFWPFENE